MSVVTLRDNGRCSGCGRCIALCRQKVFSLDMQSGRKVVGIIAPENCVLCGKCEESCTTGILVIRK